MLRRSAILTGVRQPPLILECGRGGQRERVTWADNSYWSYQYDRRDQVQSGHRYWSDTAPVAGQQYEYTFDDIGNRTLAKSGGDTNGLNLRAASYAPNRLNQYDQRTMPGAVDVIGTAAADATVTVNNEPTVRRGEYFRGEALFDNTAGPVNGVVNTVGVKFDTAQNADAVVSQTNDVFLPRTPEYFHYDEDGNLTADGRWTYTWDSENRLVTMESTLDLAAARRQRLAFQYDWQGRRVRKTVTDLNSGSVVSDIHFVYDGWNLMAELDALNTPSAPTFLRSYVWGLDLSGSLDGAGGIGGLLTISEISNGQLTHSSFAAYDGNGNVIGLLVADGSAWTAQYEYGPFGEVIRATGPMANPNPFRFSTKYEDAETDLLYYGHRYYDRGTGKWLSRDPRAEEASLSLYTFARNVPTSVVDPLGESDINRPPAMLQGTPRAEPAAVYGPPRPDPLIDRSGSGGTDLIGDLALAVVPIPGLDEAIAGKIICKCLVPAVEKAAVALARRKAVREAWKLERELVRRTGQGTRRWTKAEKEELLKTGRVKGYQGHHINSVNCNPEQAGDPRNVEFLRRSPHFDAHEGDWRNATTGPPIAR